MDNYEKIRRDLRNQIDQHFKDFSKENPPLNFLDKNNDYKSAMANNESLRQMIAAAPVRIDQVRENELLYDKDGLAVAIKSNGKILPIIEGDL